MKQVVLTYPPGLYKTFDELIVNAADKTQRDGTYDSIKISFNRDEKSITVENNGIGIPVSIHKEHNVHVPELIFGNLLTSSNYNDAEKRTTGGKNGFGASLPIYSQLDLRLQLFILNQKCSTTKCL